MCEYLCIVVFWIQTFLQMCTAVCVHMPFTLCIGGCRWLCSKPWRDWRTRSCYQYCTAFSSEYWDVSLWMCMGARVWVWEAFTTSPGFLEGSMRHACIPSRSFNKSYIVTGGSCLSHDKSFNNTKFHALLGPNERHRFSLVLFNFLHFSDDSDDTQQPWAATVSLKILEETEKKK